MGGSAGGSLGGAVLGSIIAPGVGTALGSVAGGALGSAVGGGGGGGNTTPAGAGTIISPGAGAAQVYQPQNQPAFDQSYQQLLQQLYAPASAGVPSQTPASQVYPQAQFIGGRGAAPSESTYGAYGPYGDYAIASALQANQGLANLQAQGQGPLGYGQFSGNYLQGAFPQFQQAAFNPLYGQTTQNVAQNPYFGQAIGGAETGAGIGGFASGLTPGQIAALQASGYSLPGLGQQAAGVTQSGIPLVQGLAAGSAGLAPQLSATALSTSPQLQQLYQQIVPSLAMAGGQFASQAGATTPQLQQIAAMGQGLSGAAPGYAAQASALAPYLQQQIAGANIPQMRGLGDVSAGLAPKYAQELQQAYQPLGQAAGQILQTGFDPQSQLYSRTSQQLLDQQRAERAMSGVGTSPYGAGLTDQALSNFNIDWQNQQLQRQTQAGQAAAGLTGLLPGFQAQGLAGIGEAQRQAGATTPQALQLAQQQLAGTQAGGDLLSKLTTAGGGLGLSAAQQQLANTLGGADAYGALLQAAGGIGQGLAAQQLANTAGAGSIYNQLAQGAGGLAGRVGDLASAGLNQQISPALAQSDLFRSALGLGQGGANLAASAAAAPSTAYQQQQQAVLNALQRQTQAAASGVGGLTALSEALGGAGQQQLAGLQAQATMGNLPYQMSQQQGANALNMLQQQLNLGNAQFQLPQQVLNDLQSYLQLGQSASDISGQLGQLGFAQNQQQLGQLGGLANSLVGGGGLSNLAFGSGGLSGALNLGSGGLIGSIFGSGSGGGGGGGGFDVFSPAQDPALAGLSEGF